MLPVESLAPWSSQLAAFAAACSTRGGRSQRGEGGSRRRRRRDVPRGEVKAETQEETMMKEEESPAIQIHTRVKKCLILKTLKTPVPLKLLQDL